MATARELASMTLHEYRRSLVARLEACPDPAQTRVLLAEADLWFKMGRISDEGEAAFWRAVSDDLCIFAEEVALMRATELASILRAILADGRCWRAKNGRPLSVKRGIAPEGDDGERV